MNTFRSALPRKTIDMPTRKERDAKTGKVFSVGAVTVSLLFAGIVAVTHSAYHASTSAHPHVRVIFEGHAPKHFG